MLIAGGVTLVLLAPEGPLGPKAKPVPKDDAPKDATSTRPKRTSGITAACAPLLTGGVTCGGTF